jgi:hypothetical protein
MFFHKLTHDFCKVILAVEVLFATDHSIDSFDGQGLGWVGGVGVEFVLGCHAAFLLGVMLENPPLVVEQHRGSIPKTLLYSDVMSYHWSAAQHIQQLHSDELIAIFSSDQVGHQVYIPHVNFKDTRNHLLRLGIHSLKDLFVLRWNLIKTALELVAFTDQSSIRCSNK